jgi:hypothetical protein
MHTDVQTPADSPIDLHPAAPRRIVRGVRRRITTRGAGAVLAGLATVFATSTFTDLALHAAGLVPDLETPWSDGALLLATAYRIVYGILGSYVTARLAPERPLAHALVLGGIGFVLSTLGAVVMWDCGPAWYALGVIAMAAPCAWVGGHLGSRVATGQPRRA